MRGRYDDDVFVTFNEVRFSKFCKLVERKNADDSAFSSIRLYYEGSDSRGEVSIACVPGNNAAKEAFMKIVTETLY